MAKKFQCCGHCHHHRRHRCRRYQSRHRRRRRRRRRSIVFLIPAEQTSTRLFRKMIPRTNFEIR